MPPHHFPHKAHSHMTPTTALKLILLLLAVFTIAMVILLMWTIVESMIENYSTPFIENETPPIPHRVALFNARTPLLPRSQGRYEYSPCTHPPVQVRPSPQIPRTPYNSLSSQREDVRVPGDGQGGDTTQGSAAIQCSDTSGDLGTTQDSGTTQGSSLDLVVVESDDRIDAWVEERRLEAWT